MIGNEVGRKKIKNANDPIMEPAQTRSTNRQSKRRLRETPHSGQEIQLQRVIAQTRHGMKRVEHFGHEQSNVGIARYNDCVEQPDTSKRSAAGGRSAPTHG